MRYNLLFIILGSLFADILFSSCDLKNKHFDRVGHKSGMFSPQLVHSATMEEDGDSIRWSSMIDSCVIYCDGEILPVKFSVKPVKYQNPNGSYSCCLTIPEENTPCVDLGNDAGEFIIRSIDSLFVRKLVPPIVSEKYDSTIYSAVDGYSQISFRVYIGGQYIFKEFTFVEELGHYRYEFSDCFDDLCGMIRFNSSNYIDEFYYKDKNVIRTGNPSWTPPGEKEDGAYISVEQMPMYPDGDVAILKWINDNIRYPAAAKDSGWQGRVVVRLVVTKDGSVGKVKVLRSEGSVLDEEAMRVVKSLPKFIPGKKNGKAVDVWYTLPVTFKLDSSAK